jgi:ATP-binding cassette subfamily B protein
MRVRLLDYVLRYKARYAVGLLGLLGASIVVLLPPAVVRVAIDSISAGADSATLARYAGAVLALAVVESALRYTSRRLMSGTSRLVEYDIRTDLADRLLHLDQRFYLGSQTGDLMARCTNDLQRVRDLLGPALQDLFRLPTTMLLGFGLMLTIDVGLALAAVATFPIVAVAITSLRTAMESQYRAVQDQFGALTTRVQENLSGIRTIRAYAQEEAEIATFAGTANEMVRRSMGWAKYAAGLIALSSIAAGGAVVLVLWIGGQKVIAGDLTVGQLVQFMTYLAIIESPVLSLGWTMAIVQQGTVGWTRVKEILQAQPSITDPPQPVRLAQVRGDVELEHVTFGYGERPILRDVSLRVPAGTRVALVGETGAGKTTLVSLLVRLYDPWEGRITLDGVDIRELPLDQLRAAIGVVPQESFLFSEPLRENISYARSDLGTEEIEAALLTSQLVNDLPQLTDGLDTMVGERGVTLSGGQKQRAALTRALLKQPPVLVLDDALAHVDTHTEEEILRRLKAYTSQRTTFLIAHRTSTVAVADVIVVLEDGAIVESGTHDDLLAREGAYSRFYHRLLREERLAGVDG